MKQTEKTGTYKITFKFVTHEMRILFLFFCVRTYARTYAISNAARVYLCTFQLSYKSDGLKNVSKNLLGLEFDNMERSNVDWTPPTSFGLDNSVRLVDAAKEVEKTGAKLDDLTREFTNETRYAHADRHTDRHTDTERVRQMDEQK